ncbi:MAG: SPASM domain-containing protein [Candidatus Sumerlaeota bacterium]|nr:SPASM domain-containing protein [Candidatus Sumerlaeota bacterium]
MKEQLREVLPLPPRLLLDMFGGCNLHCDMCLVHSPRGRLIEKPAQRVMKIENLQKILEEAVSADPRPLLFTSFYGEPLATPQLRERLKMMKQMGFNIVCHTNGILFNEDWGRFFIEIALDAVSFSLDATRPETYQKIRGVDQLRSLEDKVKTMLRLRGDAQFPRVGVSFTRHDANLAEEADFIARWTPLVDVCRVNGAFNGGDAINYPFLPLPAKRLPCWTLWRTAPIFYNGDVGLCCRDAFCDNPMGNVFETSLAEVWHGPRFQEMRRLHEEERWDEIPICVHCDGWAECDHIEEKTETHLIRKSTHGIYFNKIDRLEGWKKPLAR